MARMTRIASTGLLASILFLGAVHPLGAASNWGKWGPDDELGTLNYITAEVRISAAELVRSGKVFNLAIDLKPNMPSFPGRHYQHSFTMNDLDRADGGIGFTDDAITMHQQYSTQWDGLPHAGYDGKLYNNVPTSSVLTHGAQKYSIHLWADKIVTRGVLLDVAKHKGMEYLEKGYVITAADLEATARSQGVEVRSGDCLLIRTGWMTQLLAQQWPMRADEILALGEPGVGYDAAQWLHEREVACIAVDNIGVEPIPFDPAALEKVVGQGRPMFPMHIEFLVNMGMPLGEIFDFESLAQSCAEDGQYDFLFVATPLRIVGGVGSPLSPTAIK